MSLERKLDKNGVTYLWSKIKATFALKTDVPSASTSTPGMDTASGQIGGSTTYARGDHTHPKDTSKADLASPSFSGTPTAPTAQAGTNNTQIATTAFVKNSIDNINMSAYQQKLTAGRNIEITPNNVINGVDLSPLQRLIASKGNANLANKTRAQYTALPSSKNSDDVIYFITDEGIILHNGVAYGDSRNITYGLNNPSDGQDGDLYFKVNASGNITSIWQNHEGVWGYFLGGSSGNTVYVGTSVPSDNIGGEHDLYLQYSVNTNPYRTFTNTNLVGSFTRDDNEITGTISGTCKANGDDDFDRVIIELQGLKEGMTYTVDLDLQFTQADFQIYGSYYNAVTIGTSELEADITNRFDLISDYNNNSYHFTFTANATNYLVFRFYSITDGTTMSATLGMTINGNLNDKIDEIYGKIDGAWQKYIGSGALQYFVETENYLYGQDGVTGSYMRYDTLFKHDAPAVFTSYLQRNTTSGYAVHTLPYVDRNDIVGIHGSRFEPLLGSNYGDGVFIISKDSSHCYFTIQEWSNKTYPQSGNPDYSDSYSYSSTHNVRTALNTRNSSDGGAMSDSFTFEGETYYIVVDAQYWDWWTETTEIDTGAKWFRHAESEYPDIEDYYTTLGAYGLAIMNARKSGTSKYNGIARTNNLAFFAGATDAQGTNAPIKIYEDGTADGLATTTDLASKQDKLVAGSNVQIGADGKTISATDTTYSAFTGATSQADGTSGLVPQPRIADRNKFLKADGTWAEGGGGSSTLDGLTDVNISSPTNGQGLVYDADNQEWVNGTVSGGSNLILDAQIYSTDEKVIGVWINGKPIYQKTFTSVDITLTTANAWYDTNLSASGIETFICGEMQDKYNYQYFPVAVAFGSNKTKILISSPMGNRECENLTIRYTKIADIAGSGGYQAYGFTPVVYSTTEREIGVWEDNKPLYQKTFTLSLWCASADTWYSTGITTASIDLDTIVNGEVVDDNKQRIACTVGKMSSGTYIGINMPISQRTVAELTIRYTKTSDTVGSGDYNTLAIPNVHYDGSEKVIGTWFGETLYQKVITPPSYKYISAGTWTTFFTDNSVADMELLVDAWLIRPTNGFLSRIMNTRLYQTNNLQIYTPMAIEILTTDKIVLQYTKTSS